LKFNEWMKSGSSETLLGEAKISVGMNETLLGVRIERKTAGSSASTTKTSDESNKKTFAEKSVNPPVDWNAMSDKMFVM